MLRGSLVCIFLTLTIIVSLQEYRPQKSVTDGVSFSFNEGFASFSPDSLQLMSFGYPRVLSNLLWLRFLQYTPIKKVPKNEVSWVYLDLDAIGSLDPEFLPTFEHGGIFLSVITEDKKGAELLLNKGVELYPDRWRLRAFLAYHYQFELLEPEKAYLHYKIGSELPGAPPLLGILAARYMAKASSIEDSVNFLRGLQKSTSDETIKEKLENKIQEYLKNNE